jgi:putative PIN family toxin of toxin-antitoxin system
MRAVIDTNVLLAALLVCDTPPDLIYVAWEAGRFTLIGCEEQIAELRQSARKPSLVGRILGHELGRLINNLRHTQMIETLPEVDRSPDPFDNYLLALAEAGNADFLVTGDKSGLLTLQTHARARIVTPRSFLGMTHLV